MEIFFPGLLIFLSSPPIQNTGGGRHGGGGVSFPAPPTGRSQRQGLQQPGQDSTRALRPQYSSHTPECPPQSPSKAACLDGGKQVCFAAQDSSPALYVASHLLSPLSGQGATTGTVSPGTKSRPRVGCPAASHSPGSRARQHTPECARLTWPS